MKTHSKVLLAVVFVLGCFASQVVREVVVPRPVQAQTATDSGATPGGTTWEYGCLFIEWGFGMRDANDLATGLNTWGAAGWELATVSDHPNGSSIYCFKHPL